MMKQLLFLLLLATSLLAGDFVEDFFSEQNALQAKLQDQNISSELMEEILHEEDQGFKVFFVNYIESENKGKRIDRNPYRNEMFTLKRRIQANKRLGNTLATMRDELKLATLTLKKNVRSTMSSVVDAAGESNYRAFESALEQIVVERHKDEPAIDLEKFYEIGKIADPEPLAKSVQQNLDEYLNILNTHNTLSVELINYAQQIYKGSMISRFGILSLAVYVSDAALAKAVDPYLEYLYLNTTKVIYIAVILIFIYLVRKAIMVILRRLLDFVSRQEEDIDYIVSKVARPFTLLIILVTSDLIVAVYAELGQYAWIYTLYSISYVFMIAFLFYRLGNAIAVVKLEEMQKSKHLRNEVVNLGLKIMNVSLAFVALIFVLKLLGVNLTAILSGLGIGGVAVAFAAKDTIANFFGSVSILLSDLFEQGDWIAVDGMEGTVVELGLRATTIRTFDNALIAIPNFKLADSGIKNWSRRTMGRRIKLKINVTYESEMDKIKKAIEEIKQMLHDHPGIATEKTEYMSEERQMRLVSKEDLKGIKRMVMVYLDEYGSSSIHLMVYCFSRSVVWPEWVAVKEDVMFKIAEILKANDLAFAYPTVMLHQAADKSEAPKGIRA